MEAGALKRKDASASEEGDYNLKTSYAGSLATNPTGEEALQLAGAREKRKKLVNQGKEESASEEADDNLKTSEAGSLATNPTGEEAQLAGDRGLEGGKEAAVSEAGDRGLKGKEASASDGFDILKKKKVMLAYKAVMRGLPTDTSKKRVKVVKKTVPEEYIRVIKELPTKRIEVSPERQASHDEQSCRYHDWNNAMADYEQALINQHEALGYAVDETEVTDDEEMLKN